jgi:hypothetical protein
VLTRGHACALCSPAMLACPARAFWQLSCCSYRHCCEVCCEHRSSAATLQRTIAALTSRRPRPLMPCAPHASLNNRNVINPEAPWLLVCPPHSDSRSGQTTDVKGGQGLTSQQEQPNNNNAPKCVHNITSHHIASSNHKLLPNLLQPSQAAAMHALWFVLNLQHNAPPAAWRTKPPT